MRALQNLRPQGAEGIGVSPHLRLLLGVRRMKKRTDRSQHSPSAEPAEPLRLSDGLLRRHIASRFECSNPSDTKSMGPWSYVPAGGLALMKFLSGDTSPPVDIAARLSRYTPSSAGPRRAPTPAHRSVQLSICNGNLEPNNDGAKAWHTAFTSGEGQQVSKPWVATISRPMSTASAGRAPRLLIEERDAEQDHARTRKERMRYAVRTAARSTRKTLTTVRPRRAS